MARPFYRGRSLDLAAMDRHRGEVTIYNPWRNRTIRTYYRNVWWITDGVRKTFAWTEEEAQEVADRWSKQKRVPRLRLVTRLRRATA